jgi:hypothetical protein
MGGLQICKNNRTIKEGGMYYVVRICGIGYNFETGDQADAFIERIAEKHGLVLQREVKNVHGY